MNEIIDTPSGNLLEPSTKKDYLLGALLKSAVFAGIVAIGLVAGYIIMLMNGSFQDGIEVHAAFSLVLIVGITYVLIVTIKTMLGIKEEIELLFLTGFSLVCYMVYLLCFCIIVLATVYLWGDIESDALFLKVLFLSLAMSIVPVGVVAFIILRGIKQQFSNRYLK